MGEKHNAKRTVQQVFASWLLFHLKCLILQCAHQVSEAMKAQSQAFVTEDGTAVKKDEKVGNPLKLF